MFNFLGTVSFYHRIMPVLVVCQTFKFLEDAGIARMDRLLCSLDLSPIENTWNTMGRQVRACNPPVNWLADLRNALQETWGSIPEEVICTLINGLATQYALLD